MEGKVCEDILELTTLKLAEKPVCEECIRQGDRWVHLRTCQRCGITLCCDSSPNKHMTAHYKQTAHPVIISSEPGEKWIYCYKDNQVVNYD